MMGLAWVQSLVNMNYPAFKTSVHTRILPDIKMETIWPHDKSTVLRNRIMNEKRSIMVSVNLHKHDS